MSDRELFDVATHIYTRLRRLSGRTIDVIWMAHNTEYAREVLKLVQATADPDTLKLAERYAALVAGPAAPSPRATPIPPKPSILPAPTAAPARESEDFSGGRYVGALR